MKDKFGWYTFSNSVGDKFETNNHFKINGSLSLKNSKIQENNSEYSLGGIYFTSTIGFAASSPICGHSLSLPGDGNYI